MTLPEMERRYKYDNKATYDKAKGLVYEIKIENDLREEDVFIFLPILKMNIPGKTEAVYFTPNVPMTSSKSMDYMDILEYVK